MSFCGCKRLKNAKTAKFGEKLQFVAGGNRIQLFCPNCDTAGHYVGRMRKQLSSVTVWPGGDAILADASALKILLAMTLVTTHGLTVLHGLSDVATGLIPVVPVFFFISGYYLYPSAANHSTRAFWTLRYFRLLPVMVAAIVATALPYAVTGQLGHPTDVLVWIAAQLSVFQAYFPQSLVTPTVPAHNGAVWFISAILLIYATLPIVRRAERSMPWFMGFAFTASLCVYLLTIATQASGGNFEGAMHSSASEVLLATFLSPAKFAWMVYGGCLARKYAQFLFQHRVLLTLTFCSAIAVAVSELLGIRTGGRAGICPPWYFPGYIAVWLLIGASLPNMRDFPNISIGLFVWHVPVFNLLLIAGYPSLWIAAPLVFCAALISSFVIEKPVAVLVETLRGAQTVARRNAERLGDS